MDVEHIKQECVAEKDWDCKVKTSRKAKLFDWTKFIEFIHPSVLSLPYVGKRDFTYEHPWMNVYQQGGYQEVHYHKLDGNKLSYCYFHTLPENGGKFGFFNDQARLMSACGMNEYLNLNVVDWMFPEIKQGDFVLFPSYLMHQATPNNTTEERITISGEILVSKNLLETKND